MVVPRRVVRGHFRVRTPNAHPPKHLREESALPVRPGRPPGRRARRPAHPEPVGTKSPPGERPAPTLSLRPLPALPSDQPYQGEEGSEADNDNLAPLPSREREGPAAEQRERGGIAPFPSQVGVEDGRQVKPERPRSNARARTALGAVRAQCGAFLLRVLLRSPAEALRVSRVEAAISDHRRPIWNRNRSLTVAPPT
jgi:hypothetical protein